MKYLIPIFSLLFICTSSYSQDTIVQKNGTRIVSKVIEIDKSDVKYKKFENLEGPSYVIPKTDVSIIRYQNGSVDTINTVAGKQSSKYLRMPKSEIYLKGQQDAEVNYKNYKSAAGWTLGLTLPLNAIGVIPAMIISSTPPSRANLGYPDESLLNNTDYYQGYLAGAKHKKANHVMKNFGIGCIGSFILYGVLLATVVNK